MPDTTHDVPAADVSALLRHAEQVLAVLAGQLRQVVATTEEAAVSILTQVQAADAGTEGVDRVARALQDRAPREAAELSDGVRTLEAATTAVLAATQFQDVTRQGVDGVLAALADVAGGLRAAADHLDGTGTGELPRPDDALQALQRGYVSAAQRRVHAEVVGAGRVEEAQPAVVELF
ncbi:hypothetical protein [Kineococcus glutinatus]|uniref:Uncharacterized protein n=1 Tax=Kineococcus glutinatus TaxID=1070872 RepID=A0ABP8V9L3_9ACTN